MENTQPRYLTLKSWIVCLSAALFLTYELAQLHMMNALSLLIMKDLHIQATQFGYLSSTYLLADVIFLLPAGMILDRYSVRRVVLVAMFLCIFGALGFSFSTSFPMACFFHFFSGIGNAICFLSCIILCSRWFPQEKQAFVVGLVITIGLLGGVLAQSPLSYLAQHVSWRNAVLIDASIGGCILFLLYFTIIDPPGFQFVKTPFDFSSLLKSVKKVLNKQTVFCGLYTGILNLPLMIIGAVWGSLFLTQVHHLDLTKASFITSLICLGTIVGSPIFGYLSDRMKERKPLMIGGAFSSLILFALIMIMQSPSVSTLSLLFFGLGFFTSTQVIGYPVITESNPKELTGTAQGVSAVIIMGLAAIIQPISGYLIDLKWNGLLVEGMPVYSWGNFLMAFAIFPVGFSLAFLLSLKIAEPRKALLCETT